MDIDGLFFLVSNDFGIGWQGYVRNEVKDGYYLVQLFEWAFGQESIMKIVHISEMANWQFYSDIEDMKQDAN